MLPHFALYARGCDQPIICSHVAALPVFVLVTWIFSNTRSVLAIPIGLNLLFSVILVWKTITYLKLIKAEVAFV
jgi:hypothetical protein